MVLSACIVYQPIRISSAETNLSCDQRETRLLGPQNCFHWLTHQTSHQARFFSEPFCPIHYSGCITQGLLWNLFCASAVCIDKPRTNVKFLPLCRQKLRQYSDCIFGQCNFPLSYELSLLPCRALELRVTTIQAHIQLNLSLSFCLQWG